MTDSPPSSSDENQQPQQPYTAFPQAPGYAETTPEGTPPEPPAEVKWSSRILYGLSALSILGVIFTFASRDQIEESIIEADPDRTVSEIDTAVNVTIGVTVTVSAIFAVLYVILARKILQGASWARITATVILGIGLLFGLLGLSTGSGNILTIVVAVATVAALVFLWRRAASEFFSEIAARGRSR